MLPCCSPEHPLQQGSVTSGQVPLWRASDLWLFQRFQCRHRALLTYRYRYPHLVPKRRYIPVNPQPPFEYWQASTIQHLRLAFHAKLSARLHARCVNVCNKLQLPRDHQLQTSRSEILPVCTSPNLPAWSFSQDSSPEQGPRPAWPLPAVRPQAAATSYCWRGYVAQEAGPAGWGPMHRSTWYRCSTQSALCERCTSPCSTTDLQVATVTSPFPCRIHQETSKAAQVWTESVIRCRFRKASGTLLPRVAIVGK